MNRSFTYYWNEEEFVRNEDAIAAGEKPSAEYTGGSGFVARGLESGDRLYLLNWYRGELWVLGRMDVGEVLDRQAAVARRSETYDAPEHVFAVPTTGSPIVLDATVHPDDVDELRFVAPDESLIAPKRNPSGAIEPQTFRGLRKIDDATAELFDDTLGFDATQRFDSQSIARQCSLSVVLIDDDANETEIAAELDVVALELTDRFVVLQLSVDDPSLLAQADRVADLAGEEIRRWAERSGVSLNELQLTEQLYGSATLGPSEGDAAPESELLGSAPLTYPPAGSLPGKKGSRTDAELTPVPNHASLTEVSRAAQAELLALVDSVGGRLGLEPTPAIPTGRLDLLVALLEEWVEHYGDQLPDGIAFSRPGLWHALDRLVPMQNPNRWDRLRKALTRELEAKGWVRSGGPRGSKWWVPNRVV